MASTMHATGTGSSSGKLQSLPSSRQQQKKASNETVRSREAEIHLKVKEARTSQLLMLSNTKFLHCAELFESVPHSLKHLYLSNCHFVGEFPEAVFKLTLLETLDISRNYMDELPATVFENLRKLVTLDCSFNNLISISPSCCQLKDLTELNLANNKIIYLPQEVGELSKLQVLVLSNNLLREIPGAVFAGPISQSLLHLAVDHNLLLTLPPEIGNLAALEELNIRNNCFKYLPVNAMSLKKLTAFHHSGNDWLICPPNIDGVPGKMQSSYGTAALEKLFTYIHPP